MKSWLLEGDARLKEFVVVNLEDTSEFLLVDEKRLGRREKGG